MKKALIILFLIQVTVSLFSEKYYLEDLIEVGLTKSTNILKSELSLMNSKSELTSSYIDFLPEASVGYSRNNNDGYYSKSAGFSLSKSISLNEPTYFNLKQTILSHKNQKLEENDIKKKVVYEIVDRYLIVLENIKTNEIYQENFKIQKKLTDQTQALYEMDNISSISYRQSQISLLDAEISLKNSETSLINSRESLFDYLGIDDKGFSFSEPELTLSETLPEYQESFTLKQLKNNIFKSQINLKQQKLDFLPNMSLSFSYNYSFTEPTSYYDPIDSVSYYPDNSLFDLDNYSDSYGISFNMSYSLWNFVEHGQQYKRSKRSLISEKLDYKQTVKDQKSYINQLKRDFENLRETYGLYQDKFDLSETNMSLAEEKYKLGRINLIELDEVKADFLQSQIDLTKQFYNLLRKQEKINLELSCKILGKW